MASSGPSDRTSAAWLTEHWNSAPLLLRLALRPRRGLLTGAWRAQRGHQDHPSGAHSQRPRRGARRWPVRLHGEGSGEKIVGRVLAKGLAGDEMGERVYLVVDGIDGRVHQMEFKHASPIEQV